MSAQPTPPPAAPSAANQAPNPPDDRTHRHRQCLDLALDVGTDLLLFLQASIKSPNPAAPPDPVSAADAYERITRAIRRTILLDQHLEEPAKRRAAARRHIVRAVEDTIQRRTQDPDAQDSLRTELRERLDGPDILDDIERRPVDDIVRDLCRDLGLAAHPLMTGPLPWKRRTPQDIADLLQPLGHPAANPPAPPADPAPDTPERRYRILATPIDA